MKKKILYITLIAVLALSAILGIWSHTDYARVSKFLREFEKFLDEVEKVLYDAGAGKQVNFDKLDKMIKKYDDYYFDSVEELEFTYAQEKKLEQLQDRARNLEKHHPLLFGFY